MLYRPLLQGRGINTTLFSKESHFFLLAKARKLVCFISEGQSQYKLQSVIFQINVLTGLKLFFVMFCNLSDSNLFKLGESLEVTCFRGY